MPGLPQPTAVLSYLPQATEEPVVPVEPMESMLRPFNLVIPFTVQKGELTGTEARGLRGRTPSSGPSPLS